MHLASINELGAAAMRSPAVTADRRIGDGGGPAGGWRQWLAGAAASAPDVLGPALGPGAGTIGLSRLGIRTPAVVRPAAPVAAGQAPDPLRPACDEALHRGGAGAGSIRT